MGVVISYFSGAGGSNEPDPVTGLTPKEIGIVQSQWSFVKKDLSGISIEVFMIFFKNFPEHQKYFPFKDTPYEELRTSNTVKAHATNVIYFICAIIDNLNNKDVLIGLLHNSGKSHAKRNIPIKAFWDLKLSILELLQKNFGSRLNREATDAWDKTLSVAINVITKDFPAESTTTHTQQ